MSFSFQTWKNVIWSCLIFGHLILLPHPIGQSKTGCTKPQCAPDQPWLENECKHYFLLSTTQIYGFWLSSSTYSQNIFKYSSFKNFHSRYLQGSWLCLWFVLINQWENKSALTLSCKYFGVHYNIWNSLQLFHCFTYSTKNLQEK